MKHRVAVIHAEGTFRDWIVRILEQEHFLAGPVADYLGPEALLEADPDIVILDTDLQDGPDDGFRLCAELRLLSPQLLLVFVTSSNYECDRVSAYRVGADAYLSKGVSGLLLAARLASLLMRRAALLENTGRTMVTSSGNQLKFDLQEWCAHWQGQQLDLSLTRLKILHRLFQIPGQVCTPGELMNAAGIRVEPNTITAHIKAIRDEFRRIDPTFSCIRSERSIGYRWIH